MKHFEVKELDYKKYTPIDVEVIGGSRPRLVLEKGAYRLKHFLKSYSHNSREVMAEFLASKLGLLADFRVQKTWIKTFPKSLIIFFKKRYPENLPEDWKPIGALVKNIFPRGYNIRYGFNIVGSTATEKLTLAKIEKAIRARYYAPDDLIQSLAEMVIFDAWIGNMDRHHENWGVLESSEVNFEQMTSDPSFLIKKRRFTDFFDHGSSLLFELGEEKVLEFLGDKDKFIKDYILSTRYSHLLEDGGKPVNCFELIELYMKIEPWNKCFYKAIEKIEKVDHLEMAKLILQVPSIKLIDYSEKRRQLLFFSLDARMQKLLDIKKKFSHK